MPFSANKASLVIIILCIPPNIQASFFILRNIALDLLANLLIDALQQDEKERKHSDLNRSAPVSKLAFKKVDNIFCGWRTAWYTTAAATAAVPHS